TSVTKSYSTQSSFNVTLVVTNSATCVDSTTQVVSLIPNAVANFIANVDSCNQTVSFVNTSVGGQNGFPYLWNFGDGTTSQLPNPTKTYANAGNYLVQLIVFSRGCNDTIVKNISIASPVKANFTAPNYTDCSSNAIATLNFSNSSTGSISNYLWDFGDGSFSNLQNPVKAFVAYGTYTVKLIVTGTNGCKDSISKTYALSQKPMPSFGVNTLAQCLGTNSFVFSNTSTGNPVSYIWNFGDGTRSSLVSPTKTYSSAGVYMVKLYAYGSSGCVDSSLQFVTVYPRANANFSINNQFQCIQSNVFIYSSLAAPGTVAAYSWNLGDTSFSILPNITKVYTRPGNYTITLTTQSINGCVDSIKQIITVYGKPNVAFTTTGPTCAGNAVAFNNTTATAHTTGYIWYFGDGTFSNDANPTKIYNLPGTYTIKLVAINIGGCRDSLVQNITILPRPQAGFSATDSVICGSKIINFTNTSIGSITGYLWNFGDGTTSTLVNTSKTYTSAGT
ncbi:MAG: PKD domain-containing protein, partial [Dolichospermum sp.]